MTEPRVEEISPVSLIGQKIRMSLMENRTRDLWSGFMPRLGEIGNRINTDLFSIEVYDNLEYFSQFNPGNAFFKWAGVAVNSRSTVPEGMGYLEIPGGLYAVFSYQGRANEVSAAYQHIYGRWIPKSNYRLDDRPHFAVMGEGYQPDDPTAKEEIWIPVCRKPNEAN